MGCGKLAKQYQEDLEEEPELGIQIDEIIGADEDLENRLKDGQIDEVVLALEPGEYENITHLISACEKYGVKYFVIPFYNDMIPAHPVFEKIGNSRLINMRANRLESLGWSVLKRLFDVLVSFVGLVILSPLLIILALE